MVVAQEYPDSRCARLSGGDEEARAITLEKAEHSPDGNGKSRPISHYEDSLPLVPLEVAVFPQPVPTLSLDASSPIRPTNVARPTDPIQKESGQIGLGGPLKAPNGSTIYGQSPTPNSTAKMSPATLSLDTEMPASNEARQILYPPLQVPMMDSDPSLVSKRADNHILGRVRKLRRRVQLLRIQIHGQRSIVELKREAKSDADEQYIKRIRTNHVAPQGELRTDHSEILILENLWRVCQAARDEYGPAEDALMAMENRLEIEENKLELAEDRLYQKLDVDFAQPKSPVSSVPQVSDQDSDEDLEESSGQSSPVSKTMDELDYEYLTRLGNQDIARENYEELLNEKAMLQAEQERRRPLGRELDGEDLHFLAHFDEMIEPVKRELEEVSEDVERLKQLCIKKGLIDTAEDLMEQEMEHEISVEEPQLEMASNHSKLSWQGAVTESNEVDFRMSPWYAIYHNFINLWLLDKLRSSAVEIMILASFVAAKLDIVDYKRWPHEALRLWDDKIELEVSPRGFEELEPSDKLSSKKQLWESPIEEMGRVAAYTIRISSRSAPGRIAGPFVLRLPSSVQASADQ